MSNPEVLLAALLLLIPFAAEAFFPGSLARLAQRLPNPARLLLPVVLCVPYVLAASALGTFRWRWLALYALLPVAVSALLWWSRLADPEQRGNWRDFLVLLVLGLAVDLRWFERAWAPHFTVFGKILLLDTGLWGFLALRQLDGVGFSLRLHLRDAGFGLREFAFYAPIAVPLGLSLGFLHAHASWPSLPQFAGAWIFTFLFVALPEEIFFRGWLQNLLERRMGRSPALFVTAALFGLSHWNKRAVHFNWRYVLLAAIAGIFYGRAWRQERRVGCSAITHATVDAVWSLWLK